ncbi:MAG: hypothetical protein BIFFINMI_01896 [Phycisphaerae bacterium]|nr:hypothetical protein [Phycisphaerae bacterium]
MKPILPFACAVLAVGLGGCARPDADPTPSAAAALMTPTDFAAHVNFMARPQLGGRVAATAGNRVAADYIAGQFSRIGLTPTGDDGGYFQAFVNERLQTPADGCSLSFQPPTPPGQPPGQAPAPLVGRLSEDFAPSAQGQLGAFAAPLVFAGYGLHNHVRRYDDYATLSARGAVVMILAGEPHDRAGRSRWALDGRWTHLAELPYKLRLARERGAVAALVVTPETLMPVDDIDDVLGDVTGALPAVRITQRFADRILAAAGETRSVAQLVEQTHRENGPVCFALGGTLVGKVALRDGACRNVLGLLPPNADDDGRVIIVGAHYDHIPATGQLSRDDGPGVRPGADDNASGVATMLLLARALSATAGRRCTFLFAAFDSEEIGFAGSRHYVRRPSRPLDRVALMVNIDQDGYVGSRGVMLLGSTLDPDFSGVVARAARQGAPRVTAVPVTSSRHWSDQAAFVRAGVPTLFLYGYPTRAYHARLDRPERVDAEGGTAATRLLYRILHALRASPEGASQNKS